MPLEFLSQLALDLRPQRLQADGAVRDAAVPRPLPKLAVGDVKVIVIVQQVGLKCLKRARHNLPSMFGLEEKVQGRVPADPEEILCTFVKGVQDLPNRLDVLKDD